jgi:glycosyltransferase involved in cell wall biosynthesis
MKKQLSELKVAIVHEWFVNHAGSEKVVEDLLFVFPQASLFALVDFLDESQRSYIGDRQVNTSFIQRLPFARKKFRNYFPLFPVAVEGHDLRDFDLIISSSHMVSKGLICRQDQLHISYVHSPCRFAWDLYHQYLEEAGLRSGLKGIIAQYFLHKLRSWDIISLNRVKFFIANSEYIGKRIQHVYNRSSDVIYPPVDVERFVFKNQKSDFYFTAGRAVPYKKMDVIVEAFRQMPDKKLIVSVSGKKDFQIPASPNIEIRTNCPDEEFSLLMASSKAFVFAAEEDFGITMAEALACGTPVIAFGKGGACEIISDGQSGVLFNEQSANSIMESVLRFENHGLAWDAAQISESAKRFSRERFRLEVFNYVKEKWEAF